MNHLNEKIFEKYLLGTCTEAEMEELYQWFEASEENRKEWLKLRMTLIKNTYAKSSNPEHLQTAYLEIKRQRREYEELEKKITRKIMLQFTKYVASILLLIGISFAAYKSINRYMNPPMMVVAVSENQPAQRVVLEDSTTVWVSAKSRIEYPEKFSKKNRTVAVEGKVYFDVSEDVNRPFYVKSDAYTVKVLGTSFEVNSFKENRFSDVTLVKGSVEILNRNTASLCILHPGQQFQLKDVNVELFTSWHSGKIEFDGMTLGEIIKGLERYYNVQLVLDGNINKNERLVGSLSLKKDIYEMMETIKQVIPIEYEVQTSTIVYIESK